MRAPVEAVVFDLGNVLIRWDPRNLFRAHFPGDEVGMEHFLTHVCSTEWNDQQDAGRSWREAVELLSAQHPAYAPLIARYDTDWEQMLGGAIEGSVAALGALRERGVPLYGLSNWSQEKFPIARERFAFLSWFRGIVVSGEVGVKKPDPRIFRHCLERFGLEAERTLFIDDVAKNVAAAEALGFQVLHFRPEHPLTGVLRTRGLL